MGFVRLVVLVTALSSTAMGWLIAVTDPEGGWRGFGATVATLSAGVCGWVFGVVVREWQIRRFTGRLVAITTHPSARRRTP